MRRLLPAIVAFLLTVAALIPSALSLPQFMDENFYAWSGAYFGGRLTRLDFSTQAGADSFTDPGWDTTNWWERTAPLGFQLLYAGAMAATGTPPPAKPFRWDQRGQPQPEAEIAANTLPVVRMVSVLCSAVGLSLLALRFGWSGVVATAAMLAMFNTRINLSMAMAEGPLVLGLGLCVFAFGSSWFPVAAAFAASCKLSALGLWPLMVWSRASGWLSWFGLPVAALAWAAFNPQSWFAGGPVFLLSMLELRAAEYVDQVATLPGLFGIYFPLRYLIPVEYGLVVVLASFLPKSRWWTWAESRLDRLTEQGCSRRGWRGCP
ncbi:MAG: hypothetical protein ACYC66_15980 [Chloroflexota bacterium]